MFPSYILLPPTPDSSLDKHLKNTRETAGLGPEPLHEFWQRVQKEVEEMVIAAPKEGETEVDPEIQRRRKVTSLKKEWRCGQEELGRFQEVVKEYLGTQSVSTFVVSSRRIHADAMSRLDLLATFTTIPSSSLMNRKPSDDICSRSTWPTRRYTGTSNGSASRSTDRASCCIRSSVCLVSPVVRTWVEMADARGWRGDRSER